MELYFFPTLGALVCGLIIYRIKKEASGEGIPSYLDAVNLEQGKYNLRTTCLKFLAALATLATGGSGGILGPLARVNSGLSSFICQGLFKLGFDEDDRRTAAICGFAALFGVIFQTPIAGGFFAVEVLKRAKMGYLDLFPSMFSSCFAVALCHIWGIEPFYTIHAINEFPSHDSMILIPLAAAVTGYCAILFAKFYNFVQKRMHRENLKLRHMILGSLLVGLAGWGVHGSLLGTSASLFVDVSQGAEINLFQGVGRGWICLSLLILAFSKGITNAVTVGSGMNAGFTGPAFLIGLLLGASLAALLGIEFGSPSYYTLLAAGMSGFMAACMNVPLAAAIMGSEIFGSHFSFATAVSAIIAFQIGRGVTIYDKQYYNLEKKGDVDPAFLP